MEYADNNIDGDGPVWYVHPLYPYRYRGEIMGHHMGTDADNLFIRTGRSLSEKLNIAIDFERERHGLSRPVEERLFRCGAE